MLLLDATAVLLGLAALFGWLNHRFIRLPFTIGLLVSGLLASLGVLGVDALIPSLGLADTVRDRVIQVDFAGAVLDGMLSLLLFAGALHTNLSRLRDHLVPVASLATVGVVISTVVAGVAAWLVFGALGIAVPFLWCLVFGALISPTDPIAVLGIMKAAGAPKPLETKVIGESLFNDGVGVVLFAVLVAIAASGGAHIDVGHIGLLLVEEIGGGLALGLGIGALCMAMLRKLDEPNLEILITLAAVFVIGLVARTVHASAPLAAVVAGLMLGNAGREKAMSARTASTLDTVWTFVDEALNAVLFLLIGIEVFAVDYSRSSYVVAAVGMIPLVLLARFAGVLLPLTVLRRRLDIAPWTVRVLTWGGLKGGISVALAMKTPDFPGRNAVLAVTYATVIFSIVVQGLSVGALVSRARGAGAGN